jgi:outer membrane protein assembly factor BamB
MANHAHDPDARTSLRLWPGVVAAALILLVWFVIPVFVPGSGGLAILGGLAGALLVLVWWLLFSRAPWSERATAVVVMIGATAATSRVVHESISNGFMGRMLLVFAPPVLGLALVGWAIVSRGFSPGLRRASMVGAILLACGAFTLVRTGGITGEADVDLHWRWTPTPEQRLLAEAVGEPLVAPAFALPVGDELRRAEPAPLVGEKLRRADPAPLVGEKLPRADPAPLVGEELRRARPPLSAPSWPGFRGPNRDGIVRGVRLGTDWSTSPPVEIWRRPIGPGWSSFAVHGDLIYTQEQRGETELVSCYRLSTGEPVWRHGDAVRFWESNGGAGPRGTPTLRDGRVFTMGATGIVNALDAGTGAVLWSRNAVAETGKEIPDWGIASSPLVIDDLVIVAVAGQLAAYDAATGHPRWVGQPGGGGYSSPHLATIAGVPQVLLLRGARTISVAPSDGTLLWEQVSDPAVSIVQPAFVGDSDVLVASGDAMGGLGTRRIAVQHGPGGWAVEERWASRGLKPYFNDLVVHEGHAYGFDGSILACIDLGDGTRKWKGGRFGHGQLLLLPELDLLLVLSEDGEVALVAATPDTFTEVARFRALEGKTWNHPVLVGDTLLVRNGEEMAAFKMRRAP